MLPVLPESGYRWRRSPTPWVHVLLELAQELLTELPSLLVEGFVAGLEQRGICVAFSLVPPSRWGGYVGVLWLEATIC